MFTSFHLFSSLFLFSSLSAFPLHIFIMLTLCNTPEELNTDPASPEESTHDFSPAWGHSTGFQVVRGSSDHHRCASKWNTVGKIVKKIRWY